MNWQKTLKISVPIRSTSEIRPSGTGVLVYEWAGCSDAAYPQYVPEGSEAERAPRASIATWSWDKAINDNIIHVLSYLWLGYIYQVHTHFIHPAGLLWLTDMVKQVVFYQ